MGFKSVSDKPDGWYFPRDVNEPTLILEAKNSKQDINDKKWQDELLKNIKIVNSKYKKVIGILYNGYDVKVFKNFAAVDLQNRLFTKDYYFGLYNQTQIDKELIYRLTKNINNNLHFNFGIKNLYHRMVFTACALVAKRYGAFLQEGMNFATLRQSIISTLNTSYANERNQNNKLDLLGECFSEIRINYLEKQEAINQFTRIATFSVRQKLLAPLLNAIKQGNDNEMEKIVKKYNLTINTADKNGISPIHSVPCHRRL